MLTPLVDQSKPTSDHSLPLTPPATPISTPIATPKKPISWAEIASRPVVAPKSSRLPIPTSRQLPKALETASANCPPTSSPTSHQTSAPKHQKLYLTIDDLFRMFDGKLKRTDPFHTKHHTKNDAHSRNSSSISYQAKITAYLRPAANQKRPINQDPKTPNPKSFHRLMPAEMIRTKSLPPRETTPENSVRLPYKMPSISDGIPFTPTSRTPLVLYPSHALNQGRKWTEPQQVSQSEAAHYQECDDSEPKRTPAGQYVGRKGSSTPHTCRRCFRAFRSNNDLHEHLRCTHLEHRHRRRSTERTTPDQRLDQPWRKV